MYCPRCGHQITSDELRFCSYCGFKLSVVKASLADSEDVPATVLTSLRLPRQRDINIGVILSFASALFAGWMAGWTGPKLGRAAGAAIFTILYFATVFLSRPITQGILKLLSWDEPGGNLSTSRKGMGFGATLMFISTIALAVSSLFMFGRMNTPQFMVSFVVAFAFLLLIGRHLMRGLQRLVQDESTVSVSQPAGAPAQPATLAAAFDQPSLTTGQVDPIPIFSTQRVTTAEIVAPSSITEHTTNLLDNK